MGGNIINNSRGKFEYLWLILAAVTLLLIPSAASASSIRLTSTTDTSYNPGVLDDTVTAGDTFILEMWVNASDTDVNGIEATLQFDGTKLTLMESSDATDSFPQASAGINSNEDHTIFGDILFNYGISAGSATDTTRYSALTNADSVKVDARVVRFLFQANITASGTTTISFVSSANETTAVTHADGTGRNVLTGIDTGYILIQASSSIPQIWYVNDTSTAGDSFTSAIGYDTNDGSSPATPFRRIDSAVAALRAGDTIYIDAGTFFNDTLVIDTFPVWIYGVDSLATTIDFSDSSVGAFKSLYLDSVSYVTLRDFGIRNGYRGVLARYTDSSLIERVRVSNCNAGILFEWSCDSNTIKSCYALNNSWSGIVLSDGVRNDARNNIVSSNTTYNIFLTAVQNSSITSNNVNSSGGSGIYAENSQFLNIDSNAVSSNTTKGIQLEHSDTLCNVRWNNCYGNGNDGITIANASDTVNVFENICEANTTSGIALLQARGVLVVGNRCETNSTGIWAGSSSNDFTIRNNLVRSNTNAGLDLNDAVGSNIVAANEIDSNGSWGIYINNAVSNLTLSKNNILTEPSETNAIFCDNVALTNFIRNYWYSTDSITIKSDQNGAASATAGYTPFRIGAVDTSAGADTVAPNAPDTVAASLGGVTSITVTWGPVTASEEAEAALNLGGYRVYRATVDTASSWTYRGQTDSSTLTYTDAGLASNTRYYYRVTAFDTGNTFANESFYSDSIASETTGTSAASQIRIAAVFVDDIGAGDGDGEWVLLYNQTETPVSLNGWLIRDSGGATNDVVIPDSTIAAHGFLLIADAGFNGVKDVASWPNADILDAVTFSNGADGITLLDTTWQTIDRAGWNGELVDVEGTAFAAGSGQLLVRKAHSLSTAIDILVGGRDEVGGAWYDSGDNSSDFLVIPITDTQNWTLRSATSSTETPGQKTTVVKILSEISSTPHYKSETGVIAAMLFIQGDTTTNGTLNTFRVSATDSIEDTNFSAIKLYHDANADGTLDSGDTLVSVLTSLGNSTWETTGIAYTFNSYAGETFLVVLDISSTVTNGETFQAAIATRTAKASNADSGPTAARTSAGVITILDLNPLTVTKNADITSDTVSSTADTITVMAFKIIGDPTGDTLTKFMISNKGLLDSDDISAVRLWKDVDADSQYSTGDQLVSTLIASASKQWSDTTLSYGIGTGTNFVVTIDLGNATNGETFSAIIFANTLLAQNFDTGPTSDVSEPGVITVSSALNVRILLTEVQTNGTDFVELWVLDDGNGGTGVNIAGWKINDYGSGTDRKIFGDTDNNGTVDTAVFVVTGDRIVAYDAVGTDSDIAVSGVLDLYDSGLTLSGTDDEVILYDSNNTARDAVAWANRNGSHSNAADLTALISLGQWNTTSANENGCVTPRTGTSFAYSIQRGGVQDRDTYLDWGEAAPTLGAANSIESPAVAPTRITPLNLLDVPNDFGGSLKLTWTPDTSNSDFKEYRIYFETYPLANLLDSTTTPYTTITDSSTSYYTRTGLTDGDSYYAVVTAVDSWGLEYRFGLSDTGPAYSIKDVTGNPLMRFTEVKFANTDTSEFIEIIVLNDGNPSGPVDISGFKVAADDTVTGDIINFGSITVTDSDYIVLRKSSGTSETDSGLDGVINIYNLTFSLPESDEGLFLIQGGSDTILDFVFWSTRDGSPTAAEQTDLNYAIAKGAWIGGAFQNNGRNPELLTNFNNDSSITRSKLFDDTNSDTDWAIDTTPTPGIVTTLTEVPFSAPPAVNGTSANDVAGDFGGAIKVTWNSVAAGDLHHFNIYRETTAISASLYGTNLYPRDSAIATETSVIISNLTNGETYWFAVTAVDSWGNELKTGLVNDSAVPTADIVGETLLITEVSFAENSAGVNGHDWVEIKVVYDGNNGNGIALNGWNVASTALFNPSISMTGVTAYTGDYILIHSEAGTDETDSMAGNGDGVIDLYWTTALTGTDNSITIYRPDGDTEDFVVWTSPSGAPVNTNESNAISMALIAGEWTDQAPAGIGTEDGVNSDSVSNNWSIARIGDTTDLNTNADWTVDSTPTPGTLNDSLTLWRITGSLDLESRTIDAGCTVTAATGSETFITYSDASGSFVIRVLVGTYNVTADTTHYLRKKATGIAVVDSSYLNLNFGVLYAGDANGDNMINVLDGSITKYALDKGTGNPLADNVDPVGVIDADDLQAVRDNFGRVGD